VADSSGRRVWLLPAIKTLFALLGFSALVTEIATLVARHRFNAGDFFSYFTVESNTLAVISLLLGAYAASSGWASRALDFFRGAVAFFMTTVILIFIVLLSGYPASDLTAVPWDNTVLHYIMPVVLIVDWLIGARVAPFGFRAAASWLAFPVAYLVYSLIRGPIAHWYPYPFMDPSTRGYVGVLVTSVVIAVILAILAALFGALPRWVPKSLTDLAER
jgi:hypothetical protein